MQRGEGPGALSGQHMLYSLRGQGALMVSWHCPLWPAAFKPPVCVCERVCVLLVCVFGCSLDIIAVHEHDVISVCTIHI